MARTVGIGIQDFSKIRENNYFYIDKTGFIKEWWGNGDDVTLITRPRRFGKTLLLSMVEQFFSVSYAGRNELFEGLSIWENEKYRKLQGKYPVIFLSFASIKEISYQNTSNRICELIAQEYNRYFFLLDGDYLTKPEKDTFHRIANNTMRGGDAVSSLNQLSKYLSCYYGKRVIILLDEYDTPMQEAYVNGYWNELSNFMRNLLNATFKTNPYLERGLMTGITRVGKESIFSDLNNLEVVTTTSNKYEISFGFTEQEVLHALEEFGLQDNRMDVKEWYDGFKFGDCDNIYNPWSIISYIDKRKLSAYWANTSSNKLIGQLIRKSSPDIKLIMEDLIQGNAFSTQIDEEIIFNQLDYNKNAIWSLLLASGYLKFKHFRMNRRRKQEYVLALTNLEVCTMFDQMFVEWFSSKELTCNDFSDALLSGNKELMNVYMNNITDHVFSYFDTGKDTSPFKQPENFYHGFVLGLIADLREIYAVTSNRESGLGRYDVLLEPLYKGKDDGIILEFKVFNSMKEKSLEDTVQAALQQIVDKRYSSVLEARGVLRDKIKIYGFAFEGKKVLIDGGNLIDQKALCAGGR